VKSGRRPRLPGTPPSRAFHSKDWRGKKIVVTAGPTREPLDPVRFLTNASSGRMGYALAAAARRAGARVTLISGPTALTPPGGVRKISVVTARDMLRASLRAARGADLFIGAAAVADWRPIFVSARKLKKRAGAAPVVRLRPNPDILKTVAARRHAGRPLAVGFALETDNLRANAVRKMRAKALDMIVANRPDALNGTRARALLLRPGKKDIPFVGKKDALARKILALAGGL